MAECVLVKIDAGKQRKLGDFLAEFYNLIVARLLCIALCSCALLLAQQPEPPEEDVSLTVGKDYVFNPLQAEKEMKIGLFYAKKSSWKAATLRFREATKWNPGLAEAWLHLGDSLERAKDKKGAREAFAKYLELSPDGKAAAEIKKKLGS